MNENGVELPEVYVQPGESRLVKTPTILRTLLGSCVGIAFRVPRLGVGALCHPMLPRTPIKLAASLSRSAGCRYVDYAIRDLARQLHTLGAHRDEVEVKLFGGGDVLVMTASSRHPSVGTMNCEVAIKVLAEEGFAVNASSLGGTRGVNIHFNTETGEVLLQRHSSMAVLPQSLDCQTSSPQTAELTWTGQKSSKRTRQWKALRPGI
jgi:chemotaxis protein CheD